MAEEREAEKALAGGVFSGERVAEGADLGEADAGDGEGVEADHFDMLSALATGVDEVGPAFYGKVKDVGELGGYERLRAGAGIDQETVGTLAVDGDLDVGFAVDDLHWGEVGGLLCAGACGQGYECDPKDKDADAGWTGSWHCTLLLPRARAARKQPVWQPKVIVRRLRWGCGEKFAGLGGRKRAV